MKHINIVGCTFGKLQVLKFSHRNKKHYYYACSCDCGTKKIIHQDALTSGITKSCGCGMKFTQKQITDYTGKQINSWLIIERTNKQKSDGCYYWKCRCINCGTIYNKIPCVLQENNTIRCMKCYLNCTVSSCANLLLDKIASFLRITVEREFQIQNKFFDGYIPSLNLLIESDGKFWHSLNKDNDRQKTKLAKISGYTLFRVENNSADDVDSAFQKFQQWYNKNYAL